MTPEQQFVLEAMGITPRWQSRFAPATTTETVVMSAITTEAIESAEHHAAPVVVPVTPVVAWDTLQQQVQQCQNCGLAQTRTQTVFSRGSMQAKWMIIGEAPGEQEDKQGLPFVGPAGKLLDAMLHAVGLDREQDVLIANILKCRPPGNRNPQPAEIAACFSYLEAQIDCVKPAIIIALGRFAAQTLLDTDSAISRLRGRVHRWRDIPLVVSYHPAYLLRNLPDKARAWEDWCLARQTMS
ncbi:uracil-DNA glycosylase [Aquaspirillum serpens]|uniref:uracil-DNA glycosylase n=1 Tax=Aquaspirillum serpens TaxID=190 RepID=UPI0003B5B69C|nr:uracil-DNA glycosylase [Aquaspirillum serpens]